MSLFGIFGLGFFRGGTKILLTYRTKVLGTFKVTITFKALSSISWLILIGRRNIRLKLLPLETPSVQCLDHWRVWENNGPFGCLMPESLHPEGLVVDLRFPWRWPTIGIKYQFNKWIEFRCFKFVFSNRCFKLYSKKIWFPKQNQASYLQVDFVPLVNQPLKTIMAG